jgi:ribonuclease HII
VWQFLRLGVAHLTQLLIAGVDEVGRGPLAGPVVTAAVILDPNHPIEGLADSKKLSHKRRAILAEQIKIHALAWCIARAEAHEVDELNIHHATLLAMKRAVEGLSIAPQHAMIDGKFCPDLACTAEAVIKGDSKVPAISAASIIAKVARDSEMHQMHERYPEYGFDRHVGYPTKLHIAMLQEHGITPLHRRSFGPVKKLCIAEGC